MLVFIILCVLCGNGNHVSGSGSEYYYINITLCTGGHWPREAGRVSESHEAGPGTFFPRSSSSRVSQEPQHGS